MIFLHLALIADDCEKRNNDTVLADGFSALQYIFIYISEKREKETRLEKDKAVEVLYPSHLPLEISFALSREDIAVILLCCYLLKQLFFCCFFLLFSFLPFLCFRIIKLFHIKLHRCGK
jgi:hypothetical protein